MASIARAVPPSARWTSYDDWDYNGMKERLEAFMLTIDKSSLVEHTELLINQPVSVSEALSAGQYWCCFGLIAHDGRLMIARVRLPRHPDSAQGVGEEDELYAIECEVATMKFLEDNVETVPCPRLYAYEGPRSARAAEVGASYMLIEEFYGNTLQDAHFDICDLPISSQEHIITQWTSVQAELATFTFPQIGSISHYSKEAGETIGKLSTAAAEGLSNPGPFSTTEEYFTIIAEAKYGQACKSETSNHLAKLGFFIFKDIVANAPLFKQSDNGPFHLDHMDMGTQNILVDPSTYNFLAIIDWEFAQSAPWEVFNYPMPLPLTSSPSTTNAILQDPSHPAHLNTSRRLAAQQMHREKFVDKDDAMRKEGRGLGRSISDVLEGPASRIYGLIEKLGDWKGWEERIVCEIVRLGFGIEGNGARVYLEVMRVRMEDELGFDRVETIV